jgi:molybdopterin converting factor small subunit
VARLRLFGPAREAAGRASQEIGGASVADVLAEAERRFGPGFSAVLAHSKIWVNGDEVDRASVVTDEDEVAVLPPVSGGC